MTATPYLPVPYLHVPIQPVIMPVLNNAAQTGDALHDLMGQTGPALTNLKVLVVDQGSDDETRKVIEDYHGLYPSKMRSWTHDPPLLSLAATWNRALDWAWASGATSCWVVNNDVRLHPETRLVGFANSQPEVEG